MQQYKYQKIYVPAGVTVVWKKDKTGKIKPTIVQRKAYSRRARVKR